MRILRNKKLWLALACIAVLVLVLVFLYTTPSKWISGKDADIVSITIQEFVGHKEATITDAEEIQKLTAIIRKTRTKRRQIFLDEEWFDETDSGIALIICYDDNESEMVGYKENGLIYRSTYIHNISFRNEKLRDLLLHHLEVATAYF